MVHEGILSNGCGIDSRYRRLGRCTGIRAHITQRGEGQKNMATLRNERNILVVDNQEIMFYLRPEVQTVAVE